MENSITSGASAGGCFALGVVFVFEGREGGLILSCTASSSEGTKLSWFVAEKALEGEESEGLG